MNNNYLKTNVLVVGAGVAGLCFSISLKVLNPSIEICVIDKSKDAGNHILSGALIDADTLNNFISNYILDFNNDEKEVNEIKDSISLSVEKERLLFLPNSKLSFDVSKILKFYSKFYKPFSNMLHINKDGKGDYIVSLSTFVRALENYAKKLGVEVYHSFSASDLVFSDDKSFIKGVKLVDSGLNKEGEKQINYKEGEVIEANFIVLSEGADGLLTEKLIKEASLKRETPQVYSIGVKEVIRVSDEQYKAFGDNNVYHVLGYPLFNFLNLNMFGGGTIYPLKDNMLSASIIVGLDFEYKDFTPQDALTRFKEHPSIKKYISNGEVVEAGAKMIPEGGFNAIPRGQDNEIGFKNVIILGDSAGFVDMRKIKGVHNAIISAEAGAKAVVSFKDDNLSFAKNYTKLLEETSLLKELRLAKNYRQIISKLGNFFGMPLSIFSNFIPFNIKTKEDYKHISDKSYPLKLEKRFDKDFFTLMAKTEHRENEKSHLIIKDSTLCAKCDKEFSCPCISFCPAGVYEKNNEGMTKALNPSNCLHCKTCQRKCPFNNIVWTIPEGGGGAKYKKS